MTPNVPIVNAPNLYVNGLEIVYSIASKSIFVSSGACRDSQNINDIVVPAGFTVSGSFVGYNGVDVAPVSGAALYAVYAIGDSTENNPNGFVLSLNPLSPNLPVGYDMCRRIGWAETDSSSNFLKWYQYGVAQERQYYFDVPVVVLNAGTSFSFVPVISGAPPISTIAIYSAVFLSGSNGNVASFLPFGSAQTSGVISFGGISSGSALVGQLLLPVDFNPTNRQSAFLYKVQAGDHLTLSLSGFYDYLN